MQRKTPQNAARIYSIRLLAVRYSPAFARVSRRPTVRLKTSLSAAVLAAVEAEVQPFTFKLKVFVTAAFSDGSPYPA